MVIEKIERSIAKRIGILLFLLAMVFFFVSCNAVAPEPGQGGDDGLSSGGSVEDALDKDYGTDKWLVRNLLDCAVFNDYERSGADEEADIVEFVSAFYGSSENSGNDIRKKGVSPQSSMRLVKVDSRECVPAESIVQKGLAASFPVAGNVSIDVYDVVDEITGETHFVIIPNDRRIGNVLYASDGSCWEDEKDTEQMKFLMDGFVERAKEIMAKWNDITPDEVRKKAEEYGNLLSKDIMVESLKHRQYTSWRKVGGDDTILETAEYEQENFYNDVIAAYYGQNYLVGCAPLAFGIVASYLRWPEGFVDISGKNATLANVKSCYPTLNDWNGVYDWEGILKGTNKDHLAALLFDFAEACNADYGTSGTGATSNDMKNGASKIGFSYSYISDACVSASEILKVVSSIENYLPCVTGGNGHAFVLDGFRMLQRECVVRRYSIGDSFSFSDEKINSQQDIYYHANMGWGGSSNGWYLPSAVSSHHCSFAFCNIRPPEGTTNDITLSFSANGGSGEGFSRSVKSHTPYRISDFGRFGFSAPAGKRFVCWNTKADGTGMAYKAGGTISVPEDCTLYAIWGQLVLDYDVFFETGYVPAGLKCMDGTPVAEHVKYSEGTIFAYDGSIVPDGKAYYGVYGRVSSEVPSHPFNTYANVWSNYEFLVGFLGLEPKEGNSNLIFYDPSSRKAVYTNCKNGIENKAAGQFSTTSSGWCIKALDLNEVSGDFLKSRPSSI